MVTTQKITSKLNKSRLQLNEQWGDEQRNNPSYKDMHKWVVTMCGDRTEDLLHIATVAVIHLNTLIKENKKLTNQLNDIYDKESLFSIDQQNPNITVHTKLAMAKLLESEGLQGPVDMGFISGFEAAKRIAAKKSSNVRTEKYNALREFAINEYLKGKWKNLIQARDALWPKVQQEARLRNTTLTARTGPDTLYKWLRTYQKSSVT